MKWTKIHTIVATIVGVIAILGTVVKGTDYFAKKAEHMALAATVKNEYVLKESFEKDIVAMQKNITQGDLDFWIYQTKKDISDLWKEYRATGDPAKKEEIKSQIEELQDDLKDYKKRLKDLKVK